MSESESSVLWFGLGEAHPASCYAILSGTKNMDRRYIARRVSLLESGE
jgi:hypothetical protein